MYWDSAINVTFTGIVIVFAMLVLLVLVLMCFGAISSVITKIANKRAERINKEEFAKMAAYMPDESYSVEDDQFSSNNELEVVAAISAAIMSLYSDGGKKPIIKSIKKSGSRRSAWASAGIADNTKAF